MASSSSNRRSSKPDSATQEFARELMQEMERVENVSRETLEVPPPGRVDRRRWRLASQRENTPESNPWIVTTCHECRERMYTKDPLSTWEHVGLCEECHYLLMSRMHEEGRGQWQHQQRSLHNPFRPR